MIKQAYTILYGGAGLTNKPNPSYDKFPHHKKVSSLGSEQISVLFSNVEALNVRRSRLFWRTRIYNSSSISPPGRAVLVS